jgi:hypothetical protein
VAPAYTRVRPLRRLSIVTHMRATMANQIYQLARLLAMVRRVERLPMQTGLNNFQTTTACYAYNFAKTDRKNVRFPLQRFKFSDFSMSYQPLTTDPRG